MNKNLFNKARYLRDKTIKIYEDDRKITLLVGKFRVTFQLKNNEVVAWCECKCGSMLKPCSHIAAGITKLTNGN